MHLHGGFSQAFKQASNLLKPSLIERSCRPPVRKCIDVRKVDLTGSRQSYMVDTLLVSKSYEDGGLSKEQARIFTYILVQAMQGMKHDMDKNLITKEQHEIVVQQLLSKLASLQKDLVILEKSEFSNLKHDNEKLRIEIERLRQHTKDEFTNVKSGVTLDLNLEKSRAKDEHAESEKLITHLETKIDNINLEVDKRIEIMDSKHDKTISSLENRIDKEVANLITTFERHKNDVYKYIAGTILTCFTIGLGFYRLWTK